jgi:hypothetical protein
LGGNFVEAEGNSDTNVHFVGSFCCFVFFPTAGTLPRVLAYLLGWLVVSLDTLRASTGFPMNTTKNLTAKSNL